MYKCTNDKRLLIRPRLHSLHLLGAGRWDRMLSASPAISIPSHCHTQDYRGLITWIPPSWAKVHTYWHWHNLGTNTVSQLSPSSNTTAADSFNFPACLDVSVSYEVRVQVQHRHESSGTGSSVLINEGMKQHPQWTFCPFKTWFNLVKSF